MVKTPGNKLPPVTWHVYVYGCGGSRAVRGQAFLPQLQFCMASLHPAKFAQGSLVFNHSQSMERLKKKMGCEFAIIHLAGLFFFPDNLNRLDVSVFVKKKKNLQKEILPISSRNI